MRSPGYLRKLIERANRDAWESMASEEELLAWARRQDRWPRKRWRVSFLGLRSKLLRRSDAMKIAALAMSPVSISESIPTRKNARL